MRSRWGVLLLLGTAIGSSAGASSQVPREAATARAGQAPRMPNLAGLTLDSARTTLKNLGLRSRATGVTSGAARGIVVGQSIDAGAPYERGQAVELSVSNGSRPPVTDEVRPRSDSVDVPNLFGQSRGTLPIVLAIARLGPGRTDSARDPRNAGKVIGQQPGPGSRALAGSTVDLTFGYAVRVRVPNLIDSTPDAAARILSDAGLRLGSVRAIATDQGKGLVARQAPPAGRTVMESTVVDVQIEISSLVPTPDVTKLPLARARQILDSAGFVVGQLNAIETGPPADLVLRQNPPPGTMVAPGSRVHLQVSALRRVVRVPNLKDSTVAAAERVLKDSGLALRGIDSTPRAGPAGRVIAQSPLADALVTRGSPVSVRISSAVSEAPVPAVVDTPPEIPRTVPVPDLVGLPRADAESLLGAQSLRLGPVTLDSSGATDTVLAQTPPPRTPVDSGSLVSVRVGPRRPPRDTLVTVPDVRRSQAAEAESLLIHARLGATRFDTAAGSGEVGRVVRQQPAAGDTVAVGTVVRLTVGVRVWPPWLTALLTILGLGALAGVIHKLLQKQPGPSGTTGSEEADRRLRERMRFVVHRDDGHSAVPGNADPAGSPELGLAVLSDPGTQIVEGEGP